MFLWNQGVYEETSREIIFEDWEVTMIYVIVTNLKENT